MKHPLAASALPALALAFALPVSAQDTHVGTESADVLRCEHAALGRDEMRFVYGPFWDGGWIMRVDTSGTPEITVEDYEYFPADHEVRFTSRASRTVRATDMRELRRKTLTMINEMALQDERPELRSQRRPLALMVGMSDGGTRCVEGYANWPRLPGSYYFEALQTIRAMVTDPRGADGWRAVRVMLDQVQPARLRR